MYEDRRLVKALCFLILVSVGGVLYFHFRLDLSLVDSIYYVTITLSTIGYQQPEGLDSQAKLFIVALITLGVGTSAYAITLAFSNIFAGELVKILELRKMDKQIKALRGHVIITGLGRMGKRIAAHLKEVGENIVCVDTDHENVVEMRHEGFLTVQGDATEEHTLTDAGIERASVLVITVPTDAESVFITLTARFMNRTIRIVARAVDDGSEQKLKRAGANVVVLPTQIGGQRMAQAVLKPHVMSFIELTTGKGAQALRLDEVEISNSSEYAGRQLLESNLRQKYGLIVVAIRKPDGGMRFNPGGETVLEAGDILVAIGEAKRLDQLKVDANQNGQAPLVNGIT